MDETEIRAAKVVEEEEGGSMLVRDVMTTGIKPLRASDTSLHWWATT